MIAIATMKPSIGTEFSDQHASTQDRFMAILPAIQLHARIAFRHLDADAREEAIADVVAYAWVAFRRLAELGRLSLAYPSALAQFGVARVRDSRRVGCRTNVRDVMSARCRRRKGVRIESLDQRDERAGWREIVVEDRHAGPAAIGAMRIDFAKWLASLSHRDRRVAEVLAGGESTLLAAKRFGLAPSRISQLREKLRRLWLEFQGELSAAGRPAAACG